MPRTHAHWLKVQLDDEENEILNQVATDRQQSKTTIVRSLIRSLTTAGDSKQERAITLDTKLSSMPPERQQKIHDRTQQLTTAQRLRTMAARLLAEYNELVVLAEELEQ